MDHTEESQCSAPRSRLPVSLRTPRRLPDDHQSIIGAMRFHYLDWSGTGTPIVFLHGGGLTAHTWDCVAAMLRDRFRCVALDQRGHGDSEWSPVVDYRIASHVGDIEGFIDAMRLERPILVGQSMGGLNSIAYAIRHSDEDARDGDRRCGAGNQRAGRRSHPRFRLDAGTRLARGVPGARGEVQSDSQSGGAAPQPLLQLARDSGGQVDFQARSAPPLR